jgi:hypothetical protein
MEMSIADLLYNASITASPAVTSVSAVEPVSQNTRQRDNFASLIDASDGREDISGATAQDKDKDSAGSDAEARLSADSADAGLEADSGNDAAEGTDVPASALLQGVIFDLLPETSSTAVTQGDASGTEPPKVERSLISDGVARDGLEANETASSDAVANKTTVTEAAVTEAAVTEAAVTEAAVTESAVTEAAVTEAAVTEAAVTEAVVTEAVVTEAVVTEAVVNEAASSDAVGGGQVIASQVYGAFSLTGPAGDEIARDEIAGDKIAGDETGTDVATGGEVPSEASGAEEGPVSDGSGTYIWGAVQQPPALAPVQNPEAVSADDNRNHDAASADTGSSGRAEGFVSAAPRQYPGSDEVLIVTETSGSGDPVAASSGSAVQTSASMSSSRNNSVTIAEDQDNIAAEPSESDVLVRAGAIAAGSKTGSEPAVGLLDSIDREDEADTAEKSTAESSESGDDLTTMPQKARAVVVGSPLSDSRLASASAVSPSETAAASTPQSPIVRNVMECIDPSTLKDGSVTIVLKPHGLGTIEMSIVSSGDGRMSVAMKVENPLVLDAMRSESRSLEQSFQAKGADVTLEMDLSGQGQARQDQASRDATAPAAQPSAQPVEADADDAPSSDYDEAEPRGEAMAAASSSVAAFSDTRIDILT